MEGLAIVMANIMQREGDNDTEVVINILAEQWALADPALSPEEIRQRLEEAFQQTGNESDDEAVLTESFESAFPGEEGRNLRDKRREEAYTRRIYFRIFDRICHVLCLDSFSREQYVPGHFIDTLNGRFKYSVHLHQLDGIDVKILKYSPEGFPEVGVKYYPSFPNCRVFITSEGRFVFEKLDDEDGLAVSRRLLLDLGGELERQHFARVNERQ